MERQEAKNIAIQSLLENCSNRDFFTSIFENYLNQGYNQENIPIPPLYFDKINENNNRIIIEENVYRELEKIQELTARTNYEIPYFMIGFEQKNGSVIFKEIKSDKEQKSNFDVDYNKITFYVANFLSEINNDDIKSMGKPIICKGHTHGKVGHEYDNFSFGDLINYITFKTDVRDCVRNYNNNGVNPKFIDTVGMLMNPCGDFNFVYYDDNPQQIGFYKFTKIFLRTRDNQIILLPTISESGNYIKKDRSHQIK